MKVMEQGNYLIISSYPFKLAWLCLLVIFSSLYFGLLEMTNHYIVLLGVTIPTILLFMFDFKLTIFDFNNKEMLQTNYSIKGKRSLSLPFSSIYKVDIHESKLKEIISGSVDIFTAKTQYPITTYSDASIKEQAHLVTKLKHSLSL
jgi:hypothetical protein